MTICFIVSQIIALRHALSVNLHLQLYVHILLIVHVFQRSNLFLRQLPVFSRFQIVCQA